MEFGMKISQLKNKVYELPAINSHELLALLNQFKESINLLADEEELNLELMTPIKELINKFWTWAIDNIPFESWRNDPIILPWLSLQSTLAKAGLLPTDFHHPLLFRALENNYQALPNHQLEVIKLMPLLSCASRMIGYAEKTNLDNYPFAKLNAAVAAKNPQHIEKLKHILFLIRTILYLTHHYCTQEQLALLPYLIYFRYPTTDEERRSELALLQNLTENITENLAFFADTEQYIEMRSIKEINSLYNVNSLIPTTRKEFIKATSESKWIYCFRKMNRDNPTLSEKIGINKTLYLLNKDFSTQKDNSYLAAQDFSANVKKLIPTLNKKEANLLHRANYLFCLDNYVKQRQKDPLTKHSIFSFSGQTKCMAAEKKYLSLRGIPASLNFFELCAAKQGRLKELIQSFENQETPVS